MGGAKLVFLPSGTYPRVHDRGFASNEFEVTGHGINLAPEKNESFIPLGVSSLAAQWH